MELSAVCQQKEELTVYLEGHRRRMCVAERDRDGEDAAKGVQVMGRIPEKAGEVGAEPESPEKSNSEVGWGRPQLILGPLCPLSLLQPEPGWAGLPGLTSSGREGQWGWSAQSCWL